MASTPLPMFLRLVAFLLAALGVAVAAAGLWLIVLGGSWYYAIAGVLLAATGFLLLRGRAEALWCGAVLVGGTLAWAVWEAGIAWWPLAARGDVVFLIGLLLVTPWVTRALGRARPAGRRARLGVPGRRACPEPHALRGLSGCGRVVVHGSAPDRGIASHRTR